MITFQKRNIYINKDIKNITKKLRDGSLHLSIKNYNSIACTMMETQKFFEHKEKKFYEFIDNPTTELSDLIPKYLDPKDGKKFRVPNYNKKLSSLIILKASIEDNHKIFEYIISEYELQNYKYTFDFR